MFYNEQGQLMIILHFIHVRKIAPTVVTFLQNVLLMVLYLIHVKVSSLVPDVLWHVFGLSHGGVEVRMTEIDSLDRCALYNEVRSAVSMISWLVGLLVCCNIGAQKFDRITTVLKALYWPPV